MRKSRANRRGAIWEMRGSADQVGNCEVFDVGSNRYRLIGRVLYPHKLSVLRVMDHEEYDRAPWASQCGCHSPPPKSRTPPPKRRRVHEGKGGE